MEFIEEILFVNNFVRVEGGVECEIDKVYCDWIGIFVCGNFGLLINGILIVLLEVSGVWIVSVVENKIMEIDLYGNLFKLVYVYILGGVKDDIG